MSVYQIQSQPQQGDARGQHDRSHMLNDDQALDLEPRVLAVSTHPAHQHEDLSRGSQASTYANGDSNLSKSSSAPQQRVPYSPQGSLMGSAPPPSQSQHMTDLHETRSNPISRRAPAAYQAAYLPPPGYVPSKAPPVPEPPGPAGPVTKQEEAPKPDKKDKGKDDAQDDYVELGLEFVSKLARTL